MHNLRQIYMRIHCTIEKSDTHTRNAHIRGHLSLYARNIPLLFNSSDFNQVIETNYVSILIKVAIVDARETIVIDLLLSSIGIKCSMRWNKNEYQILREIPLLYRQYRNNVAAPGRHWLDYAANYVQRDAGPQLSTVSLIK